jgi:hypothetical protein
MTILMEASVENVAVKKVYVVPAVTEPGTVVKTTLGVPQGKGEPFIGLIQAAHI